MAIFMFLEDWICGPKAPLDIQGLIWFTGGSGTEEGLRLDSVGMEQNWFFSPPWLKDM